MVSYEEYLNELKSGNAISPCYKIEILNENDTPKMVITDDILADGSLAGKTNNGQRRTATITIFNGHRKYKIAPGYIFYGTKLALYAGIIVKGEPYYEQLGIFYVHKITSARGTITDNITLTLVDKWGRLDGTIFGKNPARVSFNKSLTVYKNSSVFTKGENGSEINSAAVVTNDFEVDKLFFATCVNPTSGTNNSFSSKSEGSIFGHTMIWPVPFIFKGKFQKSFLSFKLSKGTSGNASFPKLGICYTFNNGDKYAILLSQNASTSTIQFLKNGVPEQTVSYNYLIFIYNNVNPPLCETSYDGKTLSFSFDGEELFKREINENTSYTLGLGDTNTNTYGSVNVTMTEVVLSNTSYIVNYDYNIYDIIKATLKKSTRYDIRVIAEIPSQVPTFSQSGVNAYLQDCITDLSTIRIGEAIYLTATGETYYCVSNNWDSTTNSYKPTWLLQELMYNEIIDATEPILDPYYEPEYITENNVQKVIVYGEKYLRSDLPYGLLTLPKSIIQEKGETDGKLISGLADLLSAEIGYNRYGQFFLRPSGREIKLEEKEVIWRFKYNDYTVLQQKVSDYSNLINYVVVSGNTTDGVELTEYAGNYDVASDYCVQKIGVIPYIYKLDYSYDPDEWTPTDTTGLTEEEITELQYKAIRKNMQELAEWYLERNKGMQATMSLTCCYIPHIEENKIIELQDAAGEYKKYVIDSFNLPLNYSGTMTITCTRVGE